MTIIIILSSQHAVREYSALYYQYMLSYSKHWHISQCNVYVIRQKKKFVLAKRELSIFFGGLMAKPEAASVSVLPEELLKVGAS